MNYARKYDPIRTGHIGNSLRDAERVIAKLTLAENEEQIRDALAVFASINGILMAGHISILSGSPLFSGHYAITEKMDSYPAAYLEKGLEKIDPVLWRGQHETLPIPWGLAEHWANVADGEKPLYNLLADYGINCGILVPTHGPNGFSALAVAIEENEGSFRKRLPTFATMAQLVATHLHDAVGRIIGAQQPAGMPYLTQREGECLAWVAAGKTAWEISQILSVSEKTVVFHIGNAKRKLGSRTLPQAVARAVALKMIFL